MSECICDGNWRQIIKETEPYLNKMFINNNDGKAYRFIGVLHSAEDYYYCMLSMTGQLVRLSCAGDINSFGYEEMV